MHKLQSMGNYYKTSKEIEKAVLVSVAPKSQSVAKTQEYLDELEFLARTLGIDTRHVFTQRMDKPDIRTFVGKGKLEEILAYVKDQEIDLVIFDDDLSPSQLRNIEKEFELKIYDRSLLILDIFLKRAQTAQAKTQVELARYQYLMPRLTNMWTHLERQRGGTGTRGGSGEKEIETDKRNIRSQITVLKKKLEKIDLQGTTRRKSRGNSVRVALVGYTNVGKSTIMNMLCKEHIYAKNELFATVDATVRKVVINTIPFLLSDTVGFIRKLPHNLIESFKSTLDEVREADILLHVVDIAHPSFEDHMKVVHETLEELGVANKDMIVVYNKIDQLNASEDGEEFDFISGVDTNTHNKTNIFISAVEKTNVAEFRRVIYDAVIEHHLKIYPNYLAPEYY